MAITGPTVIDVVETTASASNIVLTVPAGGVPVDATIFVDCHVRSGDAPTSCADDGGNTYSATRTTDQDSQRFQAFVTTALSSGDNITVTLDAATDRRTAVAFYFEGLADAAPKVNEQSNDPTFPSGSFNAGDLALGRVRNVGATTAVTEASGFTTINGPPPSLEVGDAPRILHNSAYQIVSSPGTITYDPTTTDPVGTTVVFLTGHAPAGGLGGLLAGFRNRRVIS